MRKKLLLGMSVFVILLSIGYVIVQPIIPEWTIKFMLTQLEKDDYAVIFESDELDLDEEQRMFLEKILETLSYEVEGSRIERNEAYVTVHLTFIDFEQLVLNNQQTLIRNVWGNLGGILDQLFNGGTWQIITQELLNLLADETLEIPLMTKEVEVLLEKSGLLWTPIMTEEWLESVFELNEFELNIEDFLGLR